MRVIDCECGTTLKAANDEELAGAVLGHMETDHPDSAMSEGDARELVAAQAYDATDS